MMSSNLPSISDTSCHPSLTQAANMENSQPPNWSDAIIVSHRYWAAELIIGATLDRCSGLARKLNKVYCWLSCHIYSSCNESYLTQYSSLHKWLIGHCCNQALTLFARLTGTVILLLAPGNKMIVRLHWWLFALEISGILYWNKLMFPDLHIDRLFGWRNIAVEWYILCEINAIQMVLNKWSL